MRVAVATVSHETNTFASDPTTLSEFSRATGEELLSEFGEGRSLGGIVDRLESADCTVVPTVGAASIPSGTVTADAFEWIRSTLADRLAEESFDGVCLDLHGSMYVDGYPDAEGALLETIREAVGEETTVTAALDMHATITQRMVEHLDGVAGYRTAPHTDVVETGQRAADLLCRDLQGEIDLALAWEPLPMLLAGERSETEAEPMHSLIDELRAADDREGVYDANYFLGFPWADSPHAGCHALVSGDADAREAVCETTTELAESFWSVRESFDFTTEAHPPDAALDVAAAESASPTVIAETGDIPGAGASENTVDFLEAILDRSDLGETVVAVYADPDSLETCSAAGEGSTVDLELGTFFDADGGLSLSGTVDRLTEIDGVSVATVGDGSTIVVIADERTNIHRDPETFPELGLDLQSLETVVLKSGYLSPSWKETAARRLFALTRGETHQLLSKLPYDRVPRPIYPIDDDTPFTPSVEWSA